MTNFEAQLAGGILVFLSVVMMVGLYRVHRPMQMHVVGFLYIFHIIQQWVASATLMSDSSAVYAAEFYLACSLVAFLIPVGGLLGDLVSPATPDQRYRFRYGPIDDSEHLRQRTWWFYVLLMILCLVVLVVYLLHVGRSPLIGLLSGRLSPWDAAFARADAGAGTLGLFFGISLRFFMPLLFLLSFAFIVLGYFRSILARTFCILGMFVALIFNAWATDKTPVAMLFLLALMFIVFQNYQAGLMSWGHRFSEAELWKIAKKRKTILVVLGGLFAASMIAYPVLVFLLKPAGEQGLGYVIEHVFLRIFWKPALNSYAAFEAYSTSLMYTGFADIRKLATLMGWEYIDLSKVIAGYRGMSVSTNAPPTAVGNFYAQGGWSVVIWGTLVAAMIFKSIENAFYRVRVKSTIHVALYLFLLFGAFRFSWASFHTILATEVIAPLVLVWFFWGIIHRFNLRQSRPRPEGIEKVKFRQ